MKLPVFPFLVLFAVLGTMYAGSLFTIPDVSAQATDSYVIVYRTENQVVAFGSVSDKSDEILDINATNLEDYAIVTTKNENGILQATELGRVVYRHDRTLIVRLLRPLRGNFLRSDIFMIQPLRENRAPSTPLPIPLSRGYDNAVADITASVSEDSLISITTNYQSYLTRYSNTDGFDTACDWSNDRFISYGLDSEIKHFSMLGYDSQNVVALQTGTVNPTQYWIICGHLDSISPQTQTDAPGADDNGSGSAAVMEAARIMSEYDFEYSILYILWGGEEQGLYGSEHYADSAAAAGTDILGVVNLDMIFYGPSSEDQAWIHYNAASTELGIAFDAISDTYVPALDIIVASSPVSASDHASFWNAGYAAMLTIEKGVWTNPHYHQTSDLMENYLQYFPFGTNMAKAAIATVAHLAVPVNTGIEEESSAHSNHSSTMRLSSNPVSSTASIVVNVPITGMVNLSLYDVSGREVFSMNETLSGGVSVVDLDVTDFSSGLYLIKMQFNGESNTSRMIVTK